MNMAIMMWIFVGVFLLSVCICGWFVCVYLEKVIFWPGRSRPLLIGYHYFRRAVSALLFLVLGLGIGLFGGSHLVGMIVLGAGICVALLAIEMVVVRKYDRKYYYEKDYSFLGVCYLILFAMSFLLYYIRSMAMGIQPHWADLH